MACFSEDGVVQTSSSTTGVSGKKRIFADDFFLNRILILFSAGCEQRGSSRDKPLVTAGCSARKHGVPRFARGDKLLRDDTFRRRINPTSGPCLGLLVMAPGNHFFEYGCSLPCRTCTAMFGSVE